MRNLLIVSAMMLATVNAVETASAKGRTANAGVASCSSDVKRFCGAGASGVLMGRCLTDHVAELAPACRAAVDKAAKKK